MNFEKVKVSHLKRNIIIGILSISVLSVIILNFTRAKYKTTQSIPLVNGTINYNLADFDNVAIYIRNDDGYTQIDKIPEAGYKFNEEESYCKVNDIRDDSLSLAYNFNTKTLSITPLTTKGTKCYLYFDKQICTGEACNIILSGKNFQIRTNFTTTVTEDTTGTIYYEDTSKGRTYYFAGNPTDNWLIFANKYWRIIRINENSSIRIIYQGTSINELDTKNIVFNPAFNKNMLVGYMYYGNQVHGLGVNSNIKDGLESWYQSNLKNYASKIDGNAGFCGDREPSTSNTTSNGSSGTGTTPTYYDIYKILWK